MGWTIRIVERVARVAVARGKSVGSLIEKPGYHTTISFLMLDVDRTMIYSLASYPTSMGLQRPSLQ